MSFRTKSLLNSRKRYLQVALNGTLEDAKSIISQLPLNDRIIVEAGTPLIKTYGAAGIRSISNWFTERFAPAGIVPYIVADMKTMDRGDTEVQIAALNGATAVIALGTAPTETLNTFIATCEKYKVDAMIDMMGVEYPLTSLRLLKKLPQVVILHRGVDEEKLNREKQIPFHEIARIKGNFDIMISIAGGDTLREVQRAIFNDADIAVIWKSVYQNNSETISLIEGFLKEIK
jgi:bifunctional enzyme Fae/Hps